MRPLSDSAEKPAKTTECTAPMRAHASCARAAHAFTPITAAVRPHAHKRQYAYESRAWETELRLVVVCWHAGGTLTISCLASQASGALGSP